MARVLTRLHRFLPGRKVALRVALAAVVIGALVVAGERLPVVEWIVRVQHQVLATGWWGYLLYPLLFAACNLLLLPGTVLAVGAGLFFGLWWGSLLMLTGNMISAAISFAIGKMAAGRWLEAWLERYPRWFALKVAIRREGWKIIFLTQIVPLFPSSLLSYLYGMSSIRFGSCMLWTAVAQAPAMFVYAYMGTVAQLGIDRLSGSEGGGWGDAFWIAGLLLTLLGFFALGRIAARLLAETAHENDGLGGQRL